MGVFSLAGWTRLIHTGLHVSRATQDNTRHALWLSLRGSHPLRPGFPDGPARQGHVFQRRSYYPGPRTNARSRFGLFPGRSPLPGESLLFSLPGGTKMFQFPPFASYKLIYDATQIKRGGLSHSEIRASQAICASARLIAAYHVLHRLHEPRHPPCALL